MEANELRYLSDRNLAHYYREELLRVHGGENISEVFTKNTRQTLRLQGLTCGFGAGLRLTRYVLMLLEEAEA